MDHASFAGQKALSYPSYPSNEDYELVEKYLDLLTQYVQDGNCAFLSKEQTERFLSMGRPPVNRIDERNYGAANIHMRVVAKYTNTSIFVLGPIYGDHQPTKNDGEYIGPAEVYHGITYICGSRNAKFW